MKEETKINIRKNNMRLYPIYRALSVDIIFMYAIKVLFLTQVKDISVSNIIVSESFFALFMLLLQAPAVIFIQRLGKRRCAILNNLLNAQYIAIIIFSTNLTHLIIAEFFCAIAFSMKNISDPTLLNESIPKSKHKGAIFSKLEGKGLSRYYYIDAIAAMLSGFLYAINPYLPFIASICVSLIAAIMALKFEELENTEKKQEKETITKYKENLKNAFHYIFNSERLKYLLLYCGIMWGTFCLMNTYRTSLLNDMNVSSQMIGVIVAIIGIASGIGAKYQTKFHNKFRNKSLTYLSISALSMIVLAGIIVLLQFPYEASLIAVTICFIIMKTDNGIYTVISKRYLSNFSDSKIVDKIYSAEGIVSNLFRIIIGLFGAWVVGKVDTSIAMVIVGIILIAVMTRVLFKMKTKVGLKPYQYNESDIHYKG